MGFKGSWMVMGDLGPGWREGFANYAFTPRDAVGPSLLYMRSDDKAKTRDLAEVAYTRLVKRWNLPEAQANVWFIGGIGSVGGNDFPGRRTMVSPGIQVDYETQRIYASGMARLYRAEGINHDYASARLGSRSTRPTTTKSSPGSSSKPAGCAASPRRRRSRRCSAWSTTATSWRLG
jgi:hypothetical protein